MGNIERFFCLTCIQEPRGMLHLQNFYEMWLIGMKWSRFDSLYLDRGILCVVFARVKSDQLSRGSSSGGFSTDAACVKDNRSLRGSRGTTFLVTRWTFLCDVVAILWRFVCGFVFLFFKSLLWDLFFVCSGIKLARESWSSLSLLSSLYTSKPEKALPYFGQSMHFPIFSLILLMLRSADGGVKLDVSVSV